MSSNTRRESTATTGLLSSVSPTCSPCGHVMQPVGSRTLWERKIGGEAASFWPGMEYECPSCRTRTVLVEGSTLAAFAPGSVGHAALWKESEERDSIPAKRFVWAEHLPSDVRRDSHRVGGTRHLSQRQQAARIVDDFWSTDGANPVAALDKLASLLGVDMAAALEARAESVIAGHCKVCGTALVDGVCPAPICQEPHEPFDLSTRDSKPEPFASFPALNEGGGFDEMEASR